ncbi:MAG TPA: PDZ domain-containing protein [Acidimicrobiales bacterium]
MSAPAPLIPSPTTTSSASPPPPPVRRWARVWWLLAPMMVVTAGLVAASTLATAPYSTLAPGEARDASPLVTVSGAKTYRHNGKVEFVTVSVTNRPRYIEALYGWLDPDTDVFPRDDITEGRSTQDDNRYNAMLMQMSQQAATYQALKRLGFKVQQSAAGVLINDVSPKSPADGVLKAGDVIVGIDGFSINSATDLRTYLGQRPGGERVQVVVNRFGVKDGLKIPFTLGSKTVDGKKTAFIGIIMDNMVRYHLPFAVNFDTGAVGGPSAGLSFTVTLIDELTPKGITKGNKVAITGTMQTDGTVGDVGGVAQKTVAVRESGADYFLVPADEYKEAKAHAGSHLKVIKVSTLDDALAALQHLPAKVQKKAS